MSFPPLHPTHNTQAAAEDMMDAFLLSGGTHHVSSRANSTSPRSAATTNGARHTLAALNTNLRGTANASGIPASPVSPMLEDESRPGVPPTNVAVERGGKAFLAALHTQQQHQSAPMSLEEDQAMADAALPAVSLGRGTVSLSSSSSQEEHMSNDEECYLDGSAAEEELFNEHGELMPPQQPNFEQLTEEFVEEEEEEPAPQTPGIPLTREEKAAAEEKAKNRKEFAEMRYLVNSMYRCCDCMSAPTDLEQGFDEHAPPRRPAARPSHGPGSNFCCSYPALSEALPSDFPADLIPLTHSYLLSETPSRSFLTTPPLPAQGTIRCYIAKTNTKFELYLEMKNHDSFIKMRQAKEEREKRRAQRLAAKQPKVEAPAAAAAAESASQPPAEEMKDAAEATASSAAPPPPVLVHSASESMPVMSLDDSELGLKSPAPVPATPMAETPFDVQSPTHSLDYERFFPETKKTVKKVVRSVYHTPELKGLAGPAAASATSAVQRAGMRRASEPALFGAGGRNMAMQAVADSHFGSSTTATPATNRRNLTGSAKPFDASLPLPMSASNLHLQSTRTNAINSMLKQHAEQVISEGKDIFLLCAQRKRSWTGNHYVISSDRENIKAEGPSFYAKLKSNFGGTSFELTDNGSQSPNRRRIEKLQHRQYPTYSPAAPKEAPKNGMAAWLSGAHQQPHIRHELACVLYDHFFDHTGSPIRIKILLPNRKFDLYAEAAVGGSILKQWKAEVERVEKKKADAEAKAAAIEAARIKANTDNVSMTDAGDALPGADPTAPAPAMPAAAAAAAAAASSLSHSSSAHSAAVAPMGEPMAELETEPSSIDTYENLRPVWHDGMQAYVLHFDHHRVREKSVKNFRIVRNVPDPAKPGAQIAKTVLQFGRVLDRNMFVMDYGYPLSAVQAFGICLSSIDPKLAV